MNEGGAVTATVTLDSALDSSATFTLTLGTTAATDDVNADVDGADSDDDATFSGDSNTAEVSIATGVLTGSAEITIVDDNAREEAEDDETFTVGLTAGPTGVTLSEAVATVTIFRNDQAMATQVTSFSASSGSVSEGGGPATITIGLDGPAITPLSFGYTIGGVDAADIDDDDGDGDGDALSGTIGVAIGDRSGTATISIEDDALIEDAETMTITLGALPRGITATGIDPVEITIIDDDSPTATLSIGDGIATEGVSGDIAVLRLTLANAPAEDATVTYAIESGSTAETGDYTLTVGEGASGLDTAMSTFTIPSGDTRGTIVITAADDGDSDNESVLVGIVSVVFSGGTAATVIDSPQSVMIIDSSAPATLMALDTSGAANDGIINEGEEIRITLTVNNAPLNVAATVTYTLTITGTSAADGITMRYNMRTFSFVDSVFAVSRLLSTVANSTFGMFDRGASRTEVITFTAGQDSDSDVETATLTIHSITFDDGANATDITNIEGNPLVLSTEDINLPTASLELIDFSGTPNDDVIEEGGQAGVRLEIFNAQIDSLVTVTYTLVVTGDSLNDGLTARLVTGTTTDNAALSAVANGMFMMGRDVESPRSAALQFLADEDADSDVETATFTIHRITFDDGVNDTDITNIDGSPVVIMTDDND